MARGWWKLSKLFRRKKTIEAATQTDLSGDCWPASDSVASFESSDDTQYIAEQADAVNNDQVTEYWQEDSMVQVVQDSYTSYDEMYLQAPSSQQEYYLQVEPQQPVYGYPVYTDYPVPYTCYETQPWYWVPVDEQTSYVWY
jgi:hypothetical protein